MFMESRLLLSGLCSGKENFCWGPDVESLYCWYPLAGTFCSNLCWLTSISVCTSTWSWQVMEIQVPHFLLQEVDRLSRNLCYVLFSKIICCWVPNSHKISIGNVVEENYKAVINQMYMTVLPWEHISREGNDSAKEKLWTNSSEVFTCISSVTRNYWQYGESQRQAGNGGGRHCMTRHQLLNSQTHIN